MKQRGYYQDHVPDGTEAISSILPGQSIDPPNADDFIIHSVLPNFPDETSQDIKDNLQDVLGDAISMGSKPSVKPNFVKPDGDVKSDFEKLSQGAVSIEEHETDDGLVRTAKFQDGTIITSYPRSTTTGLPTIEVLRKDSGIRKTLLKVRYGKV